MDRQHYRTIILHTAQMVMIPKQIHEQLVSTYGPIAPSYATFKNWCNEHRFGRTSVQDEPRSGRPDEVVMPGKIDRLAHLIENYPKISRASLCWSPSCNSQEDCGGPLEAQKAERSLGATRAVTSQQDRSLDSCARPFEVVWQPLLSPQIETDHGR